MKKCSFCGSVNEEQNIFCTSCGKKLLNSVSTCPKCKNPISPKDSFCKYCGESLKTKEDRRVSQEISKQTKPTSKRRKSRLKISLIVIGSLIGFILIVFGGLVLFGEYLNIKESYDLAGKESKDIVELKKEKLSYDQKRLLSIFGYPDEFFIVFDEEQDKLRVETWLYQPMEASFTFEDGIYKQWHRVITDKLLSDSYTVKPEDFVYEMNPDEVRCLIGEDGYEYIDSETGLKVLVFGQAQIVCSFNDDDNLIAVARARTTEHREE